MELFNSSLVTSSSSLFVTGTDTGVGKSIITALLALIYYHAKKNVSISKPIQTGKDKDTDFLKKLTGGKIPVFNSYTFSLGAAPVIASECERKTIDIEKVIFDVKQLEKDFDVVIVEGIGGIAVPIVGACHGTPLLVADLIKDLNYPVIIVARPALGTINHTILTIEFAKQKGLNVLGFVVSGFDLGTNDQVIKTAPDVISKISGIKCLLKVPPLNNISFENIQETIRRFQLQYSKSF